MPSGEKVTHVAGSSPSCFHEDRNRSPPSSTSWRLTCPGLLTAIQGTGHSDVFSVGRERHVRAAVAMRRVDDVFPAHLLNVPQPYDVATWPTNRKQESCHRARRPGTWPELCRPGSFLQHALRLPGLDFPQADGLVLAGRGEQLAVGREGDGVHRALVAVELLEPLPGLRVEQVHEPVAAARDQLSVGRDGDAPERPVVHLDALAVLDLELVTRFAARCRRFVKGGANSAAPRRTGASNGIVGFTARTPLLEGRRERGLVRRFLRPFLWPPAVSSSHARSVSRMTGLNSLGGVPLAGLK